MTRVLLVGFTAAASARAGQDNNGEDTSRLLDDLQHEIERGYADVDAQGYRADRVWFAADHEQGLVEVQEAIAARQYDVVMIGAGVRGRAEYTDLFEQLVNLVPRHAPTVRFAFNAGPSTTLAAVQRVAGDRE